MPRRISWQRQAVAFFLSFSPFHPRLVSILLATDRRAFARKRGTRAREGRREKGRTRVLPLLSLSLSHSFRGSIFSADLSREGDTREREKPSSMKARGKESRREEAPRRVPRSFFPRADLGNLKLESIFFLNPKAFRLRTKVALNVDHIRSNHLALRISRLYQTPRDRTTSDDKNYSLYSLFI